MAGLDVVDEAALRRAAQRHDGVVPASAGQADAPADAPSRSAGPAALAQLREQALDRWIERLADPQAAAAELQALQQRVQMLDAALAALAARGPGPRPLAQRLATAGWPLLLVALVLLVAATVPVPQVPLSLDLQAASITLQLDEAAQIELPPLAGPLRIEGFSQLSSGDAALAEQARQAGAERLLISADELRLRSLRMPAGTRLTLQSAGGLLLLEVDSPLPPVEAELQWRGATRLHLGDGPAGAEASASRSQPQAEWLKLQAGDATQPDRRPPPLLLSMPEAGQRIAGLRPVSLRFVERRDAGGPLGQVGSSLAEGLVQLPATGGQHRLAGGDWLQVDGLAAERLELQAMPGGLRLKASGSAAGLRTGVGGFEQSLKPSLLEMAARHHRVGLLWSAAAVLWGALAWTRRQLAGAA